MSNRHFFFVVIILLMGMFPLFFFGGPTNYSAPLFRKLWDCGHFVFFVCLVCALHIKIDISGWRVFAILTAVVFIVGGGIEIVQAHTGRDGNWQDLLNDLAGTWLALFWLQKPRFWVWFGRIVATLLLVKPVSMVVLAAWSQFHAERNFPAIADFESSIEVHGWRGNIERTKVLHSAGSYSLKIHLSTEKFSGVSLREFYDSWQDFNTLQFDVFNPEKEPINLAIRISDIRHELGSYEYNDRFNKSLHMSSGWNHVEIPIAAIRTAPATRELEMGSIAMLVIFATQLQKPQDIYLDNVKLR